MTAALRLTDLQDKQDWTVDDLASLPEDLRYELIDGRLILPSPTGFHQDLCHELVNMLRPVCPPGYRAIIDLSLEVNWRNEPRPDVVVLRQGLGMRTPAPVDGALLVVEVISPSSHFRDMHAKTKIFAAAGVQGYWVIDPFDHEVTLTEFRRGESGSFEVFTSTSEVFETDMPFAASIDVPALTAMREEYRRAAKES